MAGSTVHYLKAARRDKNVSTLHGEIVRNEYCVASDANSLYRITLVLHLYITIFCKETKCTAA